MMPRMPDYLSITDAAAIVGVTRQTMSYHVDAGHIPSTEIAGRKLIKRADAERFRPAKRGPKSTKKKSD